MKINDWIPLLALIVALAIIILIILWANRSRKISKEKALAEIMIWTLEVQNYRLNETASKTIKDHYPKKLEMYLSLLERGEHIRNIAINSLNSEITRAVDEILFNLTAMAYYDLHGDDAYWKRFLIEIRGKALESSHKFISFNLTDPNNELNRDKASDALVKSTNTLFTLISEE